MYNNIFTTSFDTFQKDNVRRINANMSKILWFCALTGPAIALGIAAGIFPEAKYMTCFNISAFMIIISLLHTCIFHFMPESKLTSFFALFAMEILLGYMSCNHINIHLTWFLIPMLSILLCDFNLYWLTVITNFGIVILATWFTSDYIATRRLDYDTAVEYFYNELGGRTIETIVMAFTGYFILNIIIDYFKYLIANYETITYKESELTKQLDLLDSMTEIYERVNLINFVNMTEFNLRDDERIERPLDFDNYDHTRMTSLLKKTIAPDQTEVFWDFTNITTVQSRLLNKKIIYAEFIDNIRGWFRAQYICVERDFDNIPIKVIFTIQNIDDEKRREEHLMRIALTDELTRLFNRRSYDDDIAELKKDALPANLGIMSCDVNGLKYANDTSGHAAGDELIKAAANCIVSIVSGQGKVYRTGGDEFIAIIHSDDFETIKYYISDLASHWTGNYTKKLSLSIGYATHVDYPEASIEELERIADSKMYDDKALYYKTSGIERRKARP